MGRKRNPYIQLFTRDITSSPRCRALTREAAGVYLFLLCRLNEPPTPGALRLSDWEEHAHWRRSLTTRCLETTDKYERLQYFARWLSKNDLPWDRKEVLTALQELYNKGIIVVEGDMLIQPRMFKDNGFTLPDIDNDGEPVGTILDDPVSGSMAQHGDGVDGLKSSVGKTKNNSDKKGAKKGTKKQQSKVQKKVPVSRARASRALSAENMSNNINNNSNIGEEKPKNQKTEKNTPVTTATKRPVADNPPTLEEVRLYFNERAQQGKSFQYVTPDGFYDACAQSGWRLKDGKPMMDWRARVRTFENYRRDKGDPPIGGISRGKAQSTGEGVPATPPSEGKYKKW
jgi:hypothetical protein